MKRRTSLLFSSAIVLGLLGGAGTGYAIQQRRSPTPLPALGDVAAVRAAAVSQGSAGGAAADPATDDGAKLDGDLIQVLMDKPADAKDPVSDAPTAWLSARDVAEYAGDADKLFVELNREGFRRAAMRTWDTKDGSNVEVDLIQFRTSDGATKYYDGGLGSENGAVAIDGTSTGYAYAWKTKDLAGNNIGTALALHGTVVVEVYATDPAKPVSAAAIARIAEEQVGRL